MPTPKDFFILRDLPSITGRTWIPLRESTTLKLIPPNDEVLNVEAFIGHVTAAVHKAKRQEVDNFGWSEMNLQQHSAGMEHWGYKSADIFRDSDPQELGINLVIAQWSEELSKEIWHVHPDLIIALDLIHENDVWYRPAEGWAEAIRLTRGDDERPRLIEIKSEFLIDYLAARNMALFCSTYSERRVVTTKDPQYNWPDGKFEELHNRYHLEAWTVPQDYPYEEGTFITCGAIWRTEWLDPGTISLRIKGDQEGHEISFTIDSRGTRTPSSKLHASNEWLYFASTLVPALQRYRGASLLWYTGETGGIGATGSTLHFGVNKIGLITVFAKDLGTLDSWEQRVWSAHNVTPEGGVSEELFSAQMMCKPADTTAPEMELSSSLERLSRAFKERYGSELLRQHETVSTILKRANRFKAIDDGGLLELAKELTRLFLERVDVDGVLAQTSHKNGDQKLGSLKAIEKLLGEIKTPEIARATMGPMSGIYDLRSADAHLGSSKIESAMTRAGIDKGQPAIMQGKQLLQSFVDTINSITQILSPTPNP